MLAPTRLNADLAQIAFTKTDDTAAVILSHSRPSHCLDQRNMRERLVWILAPYHLMSLEPPIDDNDQ